MGFTEKDANAFFSMFWGRTDVYSQRAISKSTGIANYYLQCHNFWKYGCPKKIDKKKKCADCKNAVFKTLGKEQIIAHLKGNKEDGTDVIGIYPLFPDETCRFIVFDFDNHENDVQKHDLVKIDDTWKEEVNALREICKLNGIDALVERSRSGRGAHLWIFFEKRISALLARKFGNALLRKGAESVNLISFRYYDRLIPMQDHMPKGGFGNLIALPLQGQALKQGNSAFVDENWNAYPHQWKVLLSKKKLSEDWIKEKIKEWNVSCPIAQVSMSDILANNDEKPWNMTNHFICQDVEGSMQITLVNAIYINTDNLKPRIQNRIREMAAFSNPVFYKNQAMNLSNFNQARYIYLGKDVKGYIRIPRGLLDNLIDSCHKVGIQIDIQDKRCNGKKINVEFNGQLKESQENAIKALEKKDTGILNAATAFGKTVVCCNMIARKKVNTLILLQSSALIEQWENALKQFLMIDEESPTYTTPSGKIKTRKSLVGKIQGFHDSSTGIIDIAMVGSLCKKGEFHPKLKEYGMVILDECHHAASDTIVDILQVVTAKYVYGVTATPIREDGLEKINYMLLGPIQFKYTSKERAKEQGIEHLVYPRFTRTVLPKFNQDKIHPNKAYAILRDNNDRDEIIVNDVKQCIVNGRTPVILSKYVDHSEKLFNKLKGVADHIFWLSGANSKKEHREILKQMNLIPRNESMILVATGSLIGEGFDFPRLDTLIMATPVAGKSVVEQYAGRLNRDYEGKKDVIIFDYVDVHVLMFEKMYNKRLKAYKQIGYSICSEEVVLKVDYQLNSIYDIENYFEVYKNDLLSAKNEIIISSPTISNQKVEEFIGLLYEKQLNGLKVVVVTWKPDEYNFGDSNYWMQLHERMRNAGFKMNLVDEFCERYCIIDKEIVWYGSLNFLGKEDVEDNLMRVRSESIAAELLELTFGKENGEEI
ncbi:TOTE conflict system archaeo-eukaryotic primase domain-containing protein [Holdemania massiliensis]|uniref:TOTE conflict system archaeo-eukaryotic primase domain-containing protein n=1 Tax=Holdemania massiliensis TaxID=1468449 RepID=UPI001F050E4B|nr:DEAD/DEAH box helicase family protein [Holdemania massiliensis]MCH1941253.1 DEAD/DEAH box helicase family protein [Holdemania massiliensis]